MGRKRDTKQFRWGLTLLWVVLASIVFCVILLHPKNFFGGISKFISVLSPVLYGTAFAYLLNPVCAFTEQRVRRLQEKKKKSPRWVKLPRVCGIVSALAVAIIVIYGVLYLVIPQIYDTVTTIISNLSNYFSTLESWLLGLFGTNAEMRQGASQLLDAAYEQVQAWLTEGRLLRDLQRFMTGLTTSVYSVLKELLNILIGLVASVYILWSKDTFRGQAKKLLVAACTPEKADKVLHLSRESHRIFSGFIVGKIIDSFIIGVLCYIGMLILRMPFPLLIAVVVGVTNIIPFFGPFFGAIPSALLILLVSPLQCLYFILFILVLQQIDGNIIGPRILGDSIGISGFWVLVSITVAGNLFGFGGMLLGVPVFAVLYTVLSEWISARLAKKKLPVETEVYRDIQQVSDLPAEEDANQLSFDTEQKPET